EGDRLAVGRRSRGGGQRGGGGGLAHRLRDGRRRTARDGGVAAVDSCGVVGAGRQLGGREGGRAGAQRGAGGLASALHEADGAGRRAACPARLRCEGDRLAVGRRVRGGRQRRGGGGLGRAVDGEDAVHRVVGGVGRGRRQGQRVEVVVQ